MPESEQQSAWDRIAPRYDRVVPWFDGHYADVRERLRRDLVGRGHVLELGAGTGQFTETIAGVADRVTATDLSPEMVSRLAARLDAAGCSERVEVRTMDATAVDSGDGTFDAAVCANLLHIVPQPARALHELARVLRPGGTLIAPTFCYGESLVARVALVALGAISPFRVHGRFSAASLTALIESAGFDVELCENLGGWLPEVYVRAVTSRSSGPGSAHRASS